MSKNIDLGTFQWDTNKIEHQIAANTMEMQKFGAIVKSTKDQIKEQSKEISILESKIESERRTQDRLRKELEKGYRTQESYNVQIEKSNQKLDKFVSEQIKLGKAQAENIIIQNRSQQSIKDLRLENNELNKILSSGRTELSQNESAYRELNKELNALKINAKNLGAEMINLENAGKKDTDEYKLLAAQFAETSKKADELNDRFKEIDKAVGDNQRSVGDYKDQIKEAASELSVGLKQMASGDIIGGLKSIQTGIAGITVNLKALYTSMLTNPVTALLVGIAALGAGIALGVKEIFNYNQAIKENRTLVENLTGTTGAVADDIRLRASAMSETFGDEFNEMVKTANVLAKQLGISYDEAFNQIEQGYVRGANANGDFLDRLKEYGPLLAKYGFDINEIIGLQIQAQQEGLFSDKFEDSLKEAGISLEEFTKAQSDALTNAFGVEFSQKISQGIDSGAITVKDSLLLMSAEAKKNGLSVQQWGQLTADVFKAAGEDITGARKIFENLYEGINKTKEPLTDLQKKTIELSQAQYELAKAKDQALKSDSVLNFAKNMEILWVKAQIVWYGIVDAIIEAVKWFDNITGASELIGETWDEVVNYAKSWWNAVNDIVDIFGDLFDALGLNNNETKSLTKSFFQALHPLNLLKKGFTILSATIKAFSSFIEANRVNISAFAITAKNVLKQVYDAAMAFKNLDFEGGLEKLKNISIAKEFANARKEAEKIVALNKSKAAPSLTPPTSDEFSKGRPDRQANDFNKTPKVKEKKEKVVDKKKELEAELKRELENARSEADQKIKIAQQELSEYIRINADKYKDDKKLTEAKLKDQLNYFDEVKKKQLEVNDLERKSKELSIQQKIDEINSKKRLNANDKREIENLRNEVAIINKDYKEKELQLEKDTSDKKLEINKKHEEDIQLQKALRRAIEFQQRLLDLESQNASEYEIRQVQLEQETQQKLDSFLKENELLRGLNQDEYDLQQEIELARKEIENELKLVDDENERLRLQNQLDQLNLIESINAEKSKQIIKDVDEFKLQSRSQVLSGLSSLFGKESALGKVFAAAEIVNNTAMNAQKAFAQAAVFASNPVTASLAPNAYIQGGIIIASGAVQLAKLVNPKGYATGGLIDGGVPITRSNGDNRLITAKDGEVVLNESQQASLGGPSIFKMIGVPGFASGGVVGSPANFNTGVLPSRTATVQNSIKVNAGNVQLSDDAIQAIALAVYSGSQSGLENLSTNRKIADGANF